MVRESTVRTIHTPGFAISFVASLVALAISASLVKFYNDHGYPNTSYRDRIRILLVASVWTVLISLLLGIGGILFMGRQAVGFISHFIALGIGFILYLIGVSALTALTDKTDCGNAAKGGDFDRCNTVKGLVIISWIETIILFAILIFTFVLGLKARRTIGWRSATFLDA